MKPDIVARIRAFVAGISRTDLAQFGRYVVIGIFNTALNAAIFNALIFTTGISRGPLVVLFSLIAFVVVITQAFFWNAHWTFKGASQERRTRQYMKFFAVSGTVGAINIGVIQFLVNIVGAPAGVSGPLWANIALLCTIVIAVFGNFLGYKFFVFPA